MTITSIHKIHTIPRGRKKGEQERFVVTARSTDGAYCLKQPGIKTNREQDYKKVFSLDEVEQLTKAGWSVRMKSEVSGEWNTLKCEGLVYA